MTSARCRFLLFPGLVPLLAQPACAQQLAGGGGADISVFRIIAALLVSLGAAVALILVLRRRARLGAAPGSWLEKLTQLAPAHRIAVIEARRITQNAELSLVRCDGAEYLILSGPAGLEVLERRQVPDEGSPG